MPSKRGNDPAPAALVVLAVSLAAFSIACPDSGSSSQQSQQAPAAALPDDVKSAAMAPFGPEGEALAFGDFPGAGGRQVLVVHRLSSASQPAGTPASPAQKPETALDVIRVSVLAREGDAWKEAFRADGHLKNMRGYLDGSSMTIPAWRMSYEKTADNGFRFEFTALNLPPGSKPVDVRVAWNSKLKEYDALDPTGTLFLRPQSAPGGPMKVEK